MRIPVAWLNIIQHKKRTAAAVAGIAFSILLIFMQLGFLGAAEKNATIVYDVMDFDLIMTSTEFLTLTKSGAVDRYRLIQAEAIEGVDYASGILLDNADWLNRDNGKEKRLMLIGVEVDKPVFRDKQMAEGLKLLSRRDSVVIDNLSMFTFGPWEVGETGEINGENLNIVGDYSMGTGILADGSGLVSQETFSRLSGGNAITSYNFAIIRLEPGADLIAVKKELEEKLPGDVRMRTREEITSAEEKFYVQTKPVGIMFQVGAGVAFFVGAVILYQILSAEITNRLKEFATMKAVGFSSAYVYKIGIQQGIIFSMMGFFPAFFISTLLYSGMYHASGFHLIMTFSRAGFVFSLSFLMCAIAAALSLGKIRKADPADLF